MIFDRSDNEFLAVVHHDDEFQKLLHRFRRLRVTMWILFDVLLLISAIAFSWLAHGWSRAADTNLQTFYSSLIEFFALITAPVLVGLLLVAIAADGRVKLLLLFRALRDGRNLPVAAPAA